MISLIGRNVRPATNQPSMAESAAMLAQAADRQRRAGWLGREHEGAAASAPEPLQGLDLRLVEPPR